MAETLKSFMVSIGFNVDEAAQRKAEESVKKTEAKITAATESEVARREKADAKATDKRVLSADTEAKKTRLRNEGIFKSTAKNLEQLTSLLTGVTRAAGIVGEAFIGSAALNAVVGTAGTFSRLAMEAQRSGSSPQHIEQLVYALTQLGVDKDEARSSVGGFAKALQQSPGLRNMLRDAGVDMKGDPAEIMGRLGGYFSSLPQNVALLRAGQLGISQDTMLSLEKQSQLQDKLKEYGKTNLGLDPDKATREGRAFVQAYDRLTTDLHSVFVNLEEQFFGPMTRTMTAMSQWMEDNPGKAKAMGEAFVALGGVLAVSAIPPLLKLSGLLKGISRLLIAGIRAPEWLLRLLGLGSSTVGALAGAALIGSTTGANQGEPQLGPDGRLHRADGSVVGGPSNGSEGHYRGGGRRGLGARMGIDSDIPGPTGSDDPLKKFIAAHESGRYDVVYGHNERGGPNAPPKPITDMTIAEVLAYQHEMRTKNGTSAWPVGRAQWVESTLRTLTKGMDPNTKLSPELQERLFDRSIAGRLGQGPQGFRQEWDSLKGVSDADIAAAIAGHRNYRPPLPPRSAEVTKFWPSVQGALAAPKTDSEGRALNPDGTPTSSNYDPKTGMMIAPHSASPFGTLDTNAFKLRAPLGQPSIYHSYDDNSRTSGDFNQHVTVNAHGTASPTAIAEAIKVTATRGIKDQLRMMQGAVT